MATSKPPCVKGGTRCAVWAGKDGWAAVVRIELDGRVSLRFGGDEARELLTKLSNVVLNDLPSHEASVEKAYAEVERSV